MSIFASGAKAAEEKARRKNFDDQQMAQESGGKQFDQNGKPLVGRYRDGSTPPLAKRAYGAGQMQVGTAKEAARRAGIAWDEQKFYNDKDYNLSLADAHMGYLIDKYGGDKTLAKAAYHSGEATVNSALQKYGRVNFAQGLGPEGRKYIGAGSGGKGIGTMAGQDAYKYTPPAATAGEKADMNRTDTFGITDPFSGTTSDKIVTGLQDSAARTDTLDGLLDSVISQVSQNHASQIEARQTVNNAKAGILEDMKTETAGLIERAAPLLQEREAIATRQHDLATMNPFQRFIKSTFDPNYNGADLRGRDAATKNLLGVLGENYTYVTNLQTATANIMESEYKDQAELWGLHNDSLIQDVALVNQSVGVANAKLDITLKGLDAQMGLIRAQTQAKQQTMSQMSESQVQIALEQAKADPNGMATVNGTPLSVGELTQLSNGYRDQDMALQSRQLALEGQRMGLADAYEDKAIEHMTPDQIQEAINNGGNYKGQQLNLTKLTEAYGKVRAIQQQQVTDIEVNSAPGRVTQTLNAIQSSMVGTSARMKDLFGNLPDEQRNMMVATATELHNIGAAFKEADAKGVGNQYAAAVLPRVQALYAQQDAVTKNVVTRWAGGNKDLAAVGESWLRGQPITSEAGIRGLISMARNGTPAGMKLDGISGQVFKAVRAEVAKFDQPGTNKDPSAIFNATPQGKAERDKALQAKVGVAVRNIYNNAMIHTVLQQAPTIARNVKINGAPHPFARVSQEDMMNSVNYGDQEGYKRIGKKPGDQLTPDEKRQLLIAQTQGFLEALDANASEPGFKPSQAYASLVNNPQFQAQVSQMAGNQARSSFGNFITSATGGGDFAQNFVGYAHMVSQGYTATQVANTAKRISDQKSMLADPWQRTRYVIQAMDGVSTSDANALIQAIQPAVQKKFASANVGQAVSGMMGLASMTPEQAQIRGNPFGVIEDIVINQKLADPKAEAIRKRIAGQWSAARQTVDRIAATSQGE